MADVQEGLTPAIDGSLLSLPVWAGSRWYVVHGVLAVALEGTDAEMVAAIARNKLRATALQPDVVLDTRPIVAAWATREQFRPVLVFRLIHTTLEVLDEDERARTLYADAHVIPSQPTVSWKR